MEVGIRPSVTAPIVYKGDRQQHLKEKVRDNSTELTVGGGAGLAAFGTINQSSRIGNSFMRALKEAKSVKVTRQNQILELVAKCKPLSKFATNPVVRKVAGGFAGLSAVTTLIGSTAKIADTYGFLSAQNPAA